MASFLFKKQPSKDVTRRFGFELSRDGRGLGRKKQLTSEQMTTLTPGSLCDYPTGVDNKAPLLKTDINQ